MKYVYSEKMGLILFSEHVNHAEFARAIGGKVVSAGFVDLVAGVCYGESLSLGLKASIQDTETLKREVQNVRKL